jgi:hypothetical protein
VGGWVGWLAVGVGAVRILGADDKTGIKMR